MDRVNVSGTAWKRSIMSGSQWVWHLQTLRLHPGHIRDLAADGVAVDVNNVHGRLRRILGPREG